MINAKKVAQIFCDLRDKMRLTKFIHDPRTRACVPFRQIISLLCSHALFNCKSLLALDMLARMPHIKRLFGSKRVCVASDSSLQRMIRAVRYPEVARMLTHVAEEAKSHGFDRSRLDRNTKKSIAVVDGSFLMGHWHAVLANVVGYAAVPRMIAPTRTRGDELKTAIAMITRMPKKTAPELVMGDGLYLCEEFFRAVRDRNAHCVVKYPDNPTEKERNIFKTARIRFKNPAIYHACVETKEGYDSTRLRSYRIFATEEVFAGMPVRVVYVREEKSKKREKDVLPFWVVSTDMTLSLEAIREAAHLRWSVENGGFKTLSRLAGTKKKACAEQEAATALLHFIAVSFILSLCVRARLEREGLSTKEFYRFAKPTWGMFLKCLSLYLREAGVVVFR